MLPLSAQLSTNSRASDNRGAVRRSLTLEVRTFSPEDTSNALVRNLSERGLLIETAADLTIGETIHVDLPEAGASEARIVWRDGSFFGCEFLTPMPKAAVSAALLLAPVERAPATGLPDLPDGSVFGDVLGDDRAQPELEREAYSPGTDVVLMVSLVVALLMAALFVYALLTFPFST